MLHNVFKVAQTEHSTSVSSPLKHVFLLTTPGSRVVGEEGTISLE